MDYSLQLDSVFRITIKHRPVATVKYGIKAFSLVFRNCESTPRYDYLPSNNDEFVMNMALHLPSRRAPTKLLPTTAPGEVLKIKMFYFQSHKLDFTYSSEHHYQTQCHTSETKGIFY